MEDGIKSIQLGYAASVSWVPDGIPVRPDDFQPPGMTIRVTRKPGVPGGDQGCKATVRDNLQLDAALLQNPPAGYENFVKNLPHPLSQLTPYDFFANEADLTSQGFPGGSDKALSVPPLAPGESFTIPMTFVPNYYKNGWHRDEIAALFRLSSRDIQAAIDYIEAHKDEVQAEYLKILDRHHNYKYPPEVQKVVDECRGKAEQRLREIRQRRAQENRNADHHG